MEKTRNTSRKFWAVRLLCTALALTLALLAAGCGATVKENENDLGKAEALLERQAVMDQRPEWVPQELTPLAYAEKDGIVAAIYTPKQDAGAADERYIICADAAGTVSFKAYSQERQGLPNYDNLAFYGSSTQSFCFYDRTEGVWLANAPTYENRVFRAHGLGEECPLLLSSGMDEGDGVLWFAANRTVEADANFPDRETRYADIIAYDTASETLTLVQQQAENPNYYRLDSTENNTNAPYVLRSGDYDGYRFYSGSTLAGEVSPATLPTLTDGGRYAYHYQVGTQQQGAFRIVMMYFDYRPQQAVPLSAQYVEEAYDMGTTWQCVVLDENCKILKCFDTGIPAVWADALTETPNYYGNATLYFNAIENDILYTAATLPQGGEVVNSHWAVSLSENSNAVTRID